MSKTTPFMYVTNEKISKGDTVTIEGKRCIVTSINSVEPFVGNKYKIIGRCKHSTIDGWKAVIENS